MIKNNADVLVTFYAYMNDLNFEYSKDIVIKNKYLEKFTKRATEKFESENVKECARNMLKEIHN